MQHNRENSPVFGAVTPRFLFIALAEQTLGRILRSVREKCAEQPGLLSVNALKQTINIEPVHQSKLKARRSVLTILGEAFCSATFLEKQNNDLLSVSVHIRKKWEYYFSFPWSKLFMRLVALSFKLLFIFGKHSKRLFPLFAINLCTCWPFSLRRQSC